MKISYFQNLDTFLSHLVALDLYLNFYPFIFYLPPLGSQLNPLNHILSHFIQAGMGQTLSRKLCLCLNSRAVSWFLKLFIYCIKKNLLFFSFFPAATDCHLTATELSSDTGLYQ